MVNRMELRRLYVALALLALLLGLLRAPMLSSARPLGARCFPETDQCIDGRFQTYWEQNGGLAVFGFPITPARDERNRDTGQVYLTQWFERNRFEYHPENRAPYDVLLGRLGDDRLRQLGRNWQAAAREPGARAGCLWFAETGRNVCDQTSGAGFMSYWRTHGLRDARLDPQGRSLALLGLPLTGAATELNSSGDRVLTQWFERGRLEWHPNNPSEYRVLLGLLGNELRQGSGGAEPTATNRPSQPTATRTPAPTATNTPSPTPTRTTRPASPLGRRDTPPAGVGRAGNVAFVAIFCEQESALVNSSVLDAGQQFIARRLVICLSTTAFDPALPVSYEVKHGASVVDSASVTVSPQGGESSQLRWVPKTGYPFGRYVMTISQGANTATVNFELTQYATLGEFGSILVVDVNHRPGATIEFVLGGFQPGVPVPLYLYGVAACPPGEDDSTGTPACYITQLGPVIPDARGEATYSLATEAGDPPGDYFLSARPDPNPQGGFSAFRLEP